MRKFLFILFLLMTNIHADDAWSVFNHFKKEAMIVADFTITNYDDKNEPYDKQVGTYYYHPQYGSKWKATDPYQQITWVNKTGVIIYDMPLNQVTEKKFTNLNFDTPAKILSCDTSELIKDYNAFLSEDRTLTLIPKNKSNLFKKVSIHLSSKYVPLSIEILDSINYKCKMEIKVTQQTPDKKDFDVVYPSNVEVIK